MSREVVRQSAAVAKMSTRAADVLFGSAPATDVVVGELGELTGLVRRILSRMVELPPAHAMGFAAAGVVPVQLEPAMALPTEWVLPMPVWEPGDFTVPPQ